MEEEKKEKSGMYYVVVALFFFVTIILAQQILDMFFREENTARVAAKIIIDAFIVAFGLGFKHKIISNIILYAGLVRFILVLFQLQGMDPLLRVIVLSVTVVVILAVGVIKFGKNPSAQINQK